MNESNEFRLVLISNYDIHIRYKIVNSSYQMDILIEVLTFAL